MANGTITATFIYNGSGINQPLAGAYVYLHAYPLGAPIMEKYFRKAQYILGPSDANGNISVSVPEGIYHIRITRRAPLSSTSTQAQAYGPPRSGDYTWHMAGSSSTITVTTGSVTTLGTIYAQIFSGSAPIAISGQVTDHNYGYGDSGLFVMATTTFIRPGLPRSYPLSGPKYPAGQPTDSNGNYVIKLKNPGTYYVYALSQPPTSATRGNYPSSTCLQSMNLYGEIYSTPNACWSSLINRISDPRDYDCVPYCPIIVNNGDQLTGMDISWDSWTSGRY
ncbi:MAG: hypothetical protein M0033_04370, partial [Nitrospiraceae bacterium]|nr:hypothetical protein [Nitrospiraceae bacterium]